MLLIVEKSGKMGCNNAQHYVDSIIPIERLVRGKDGAEGTMLQARHQVAVLQEETEGLLRDPQQQINNKRGSRSLFTVDTSWRSP